jgi:hypothetical protein
MITRRNFIQLFGATVVAGLSINSPVNIFGQTRREDDLFPIPPESLSDPVSSFTSAHFTPFINGDFQVRQNDLRETTSLQLIDVEIFQRKANLAKGAIGESFSLVFRGSLPENLAGDRFEFSHPSLGVFTLFLAPVSKERNRYEAVINHLKA